MQVVYGILLISVVHETHQQLIDCPVSNCLRCDNGQCTLCQLGYYGLDCGKQCPANCVQICLSGFCHKGCKKGWYGLRCQTVCPRGCAVCDQSTGYCPRTEAPSEVEECSEGCYCIFGHCSQCKPGYTGDDCHIDKMEKEYSNSNYANMQAALVGIGLLLGVVVLVSCATFVFCRKYKHSRRTSVNNCAQRRGELSTQSTESVTSVELHQMGDNSNHQVSLPPYYVSYPPPSYNSLFLTVNPETDKPPPYEATDQL